MANIEETWIVDHGQYRDAYYETIERAQHEIPRPVLEKISIPSANVLSGQVAEQLFRVLVVGQETYDTSVRLAGCRPWDAWANQIGSAIAFDYAYRAEQEGRRFWRAFDEIVMRFQLSSRRALAWSNLISVQLIDTNNGSKSITRCFSEDRMTILKWQRRLLREEFRFLKPDAVLFLTGSVHWVANFVFEGHRTRELCHNVNVVEVEDDTFKVPMAQTYHPDACRYGSVTVAALSEARAKACDYLKQQLRSVRD